MTTDYKLHSTDKLTALAKNNGIETWNELTKFIQSLPYGRNSNRTDVGLVMSELKGTCSSKHALLKSIADFNNIPNIELIIGIYRMNESNTPKIGNELSKNLIPFIPEAHCYLKVDNQRVDYTSEKSEFEKIEKDIMEEIAIELNQVAEFKVDYHKTFIQKWLIKTNSTFAFDDIWQIREKCIENLTGVC